MIKIDYSNIPQEYLDYINRFRGKISRWYQANSMGNGKTRIILCPECKLIFRFLMKGDNLKKLLLSSASNLPMQINKVEEKFPVLKNDRLNSSKSILYQCLYKAFYTLGYHEDKFPSFELTQALNLKACPYCNAEDVIVQDLQDKDVRIRNCELDHFYSKKYYPYLAISLYNLVPSGNICNGGNCKHEKDTLREGLISPFELQDSEGLRFELELNDKGASSYDTFTKSISIRTHVVNTALTNNARIFLIASRYSKELEQARLIWTLYKKCSAEGYRKMIVEKSRLLNTTLTFDTWFESELNITPSNYSNHKLSKLSMDIWRQLEGMR